MLALKKLEQSLKTSSTKEAKESYTKSVKVMEEALKTLSVLVRRKGRAVVQELKTLESKLKTCKTLECRKEVVDRCLVVKESASVMCYVSKRGATMCPHMDVCKKDLQEAWSGCHTDMLRIEAIAKTVVGMEKKVIKEARKKTMSKSVVRKEQKVLKKAVALKDEEISVAIRSAALKMKSSSSSSSSMETSVVSMSHAHLKLHTAAFCKSKRQVLKAHAEVARVELSLCDDKKCRKEHLAQAARVRSELAKLNATCKLATVADKKQVKKQHDKKKITTKKAKKAIKRTKKVTKKTLSYCESRLAVIRSHVHLAKVALSLCDNVKCRMENSAKIHTAMAEKAALRDCRDTASHDTNAPFLVGPAAVARDRCDGKVSEWHQRREKANSKLAQLYTEASKCETRSCTRAALKNLKAEHQILASLKRPSCVDKYLKAASKQKQQVKEDEKEEARDAKRREKLEQEEAQGKKVKKTEMVVPNIKYVSKAHIDDVPPVGEIFLLKDAQN